MYLLAHQLQCGVILDSGKIQYLQNNIKSQTFSCKCPYCIFKLKILIKNNQKVTFIVERPHTCLILNYNQRFVKKQVQVYPIQIVRFLRITQLQLNSESVKQILCNLVITAINKFDIINALSQSCSQFMVPNDSFVENIQYYNNFIPDAGAINTRAIKARKQDEMITGQKQQLIDTQQWNQKQIDEYIYDVMSKI